MKYDERNGKEIPENDREKRLLEEGVSICNILNKNNRGKNHDRTDLD